MEDLQDKIIELMDLFDDEQVTTADKIDRPQQALDRDMYKDFMDRNPMAGGGMLVQPSADGSRPGYASDFVNINDIKKYNKNLLDKSIVVSETIKAGANQAERVTLQNIFDVVGRTQGGDELIKNFKKKPNAENFLKLRIRRKNRLSFEREQALPPEEKAELRKKQKIAEQKWRNSKKGIKYYNNFLSQSGIFPARTAEERVWRDLYRASKQKKGESRFILKYPKSVNIDKESGLPKTVTSKLSGREYIPWDRFYKDITFYDTVTKKNIKFNTIRNWMANNIENGANKYDNAVKNYKASNVINTFEVDGVALSKLAKDKQEGSFIKRITTAAAVNHRSGLNNFWDTEVTTASGNKMLNDKVQQSIAAYKNASNPNIEKKLLNNMKQNAKKIEGGGTIVLDDKTVLGKTPTTKSVVSALEKELDVKIPFKSIQTQLAAIGCPGKAKGGRVGFNEGTNYQRCVLKGIKEVQTKSPNQLTPGARANFTKITSTMQGARLMKNILGPGALAYEALFAAPFAVYDYASGRPGEDVLKNFLTLGIADQKLYENELKRKFPDYGKAQYLMDFDDRISEYERQMGGTKGQMRRAKPKLNIALDKFKNDPTRLEFAQTEDPAASLFENFLKSQEAEQAVAQDRANLAAERGFGESAPQLDLGDFSYGEMAKGGRAGYNDGKLVEPVEIDMSGYKEKALQDMHKHYKYYKKMGGRMKKRQFANEFFRQYHSSGGIASGPPPESGPNSQGLQGLLNRAKKLKE